MNSEQFSVIVVGAGHAGCEAALATSRRGISTLLITSNIDQVAAMSCNPAIGGLGKGHLVREIDALGGEMAKNIDETGIQFRRLNSRKGTAVQGTRAQADKYLYKTRMRFVLECQKNLHIKQGVVKSIIVQAGLARGVELTTGNRFSSKAVIITTGTFLRGICHIGMKNFSAGRAGDPAENDLSLSLLNDCGLILMRLKTGTVPRLDGKTINYQNLEEQHGDFPLPLFSFSNTSVRQKQLPCFITYTNIHTHNIIRGDLDNSPLFQGVIKGRGPRYCPSIEDKVVRFPEKERHQIFLEPEGLMTHEVYPNGLSTSLPLKTQIDFIRSIDGLENAEITRPGYAVEYDAAEPTQICSSYETKNIKGLFLAGQINGTSGYEEAAAQGLMAGINAGQYFLELEPVVLPRDKAYIGVMTDDLVTKGVGGEPYRMFTSRAEYRLILREDNADIRLGKIGHDVGLVSDEIYKSYEEKLTRAEGYIINFQSRRVHKSEHPILKCIERDLQIKIPDTATIEQMIKWPHFTISHFEKVWKDIGSDIEFDDGLIRHIFSEIRYKGYIERHNKQIGRMSHYDKIRIPSPLPIEMISNLSSEVREKLSANKPQTLGQALRIPGMTPSAIAHIEVFLSTYKFNDS